MPQEKLLKFRVPEVEDKEVYLVRLEDGRIVARTKEELEEEEEKEEALGLSFRKGRKVKDKVTGERGEVLYGTIKRIAKK